MTHFSDRLAARVRRYGPTCIGLDPHAALLPRALVDGLPPTADPAYRVAAAAAAERFCAEVVAIAADRVAAVKPQVAFFEALGAPGVAALERVCAAARAAGLPVVLDAKRGDIGSTAEAYAHAALDDAGPTGADAVTLSPWLGPESIAPFLRRTPEKGLFLLVRTSNPGALAWQGAAGAVADWIASQPDRGDCGLGAVGAVVGATLPGEAASWRARMPHAWILVPGYGAQGGTRDDVAALRRPDGLGALVVSARGVLFPPGGADPGADWAAGVRQRADAFAADLG